MVNINFISLSDIELNNTPTMKHILLSVCLFALATSIHSQTTVYLNANDQPVKKASKATKYMIINRDSVNPDKATTRLYDMGNHILKLNNFSSFIFAKQDGIQREWYLNGQLKSEWIMQDGKLNGYNRTWFANGQIKNDSYYKDNLQFGSDKEWHENGKLLRSAEYANNKKNGKLLTYWPNGQLRRVDVYDMGELKEGQCSDSLGNKIPYIRYEEMPQFPAGDLSFYLAREVRYPIMAQKNAIQGRVIVQFIVDKNGTISEIKVVRSVDSSLDREAIRVVSSMPNWIPGKIEGEPVKVKYTLPINFRLR
jgi:protein TonB